MKYILFIFVVSIASLLHAQSLEWEAFEKDPYFSYELPKGFTKTSAKNQTTYSSSGEFCIFMISAIRQPGLQTSIPQNIKEYYRSILKTIVPARSTASDSSMMFRGFLADRITIRINADDDTHVTEATFVLVKDICYTFSITFSESTREKSREERDHFISSIRAVSGHPYRYQYTHFDENYETGQKIGRIARYILPILVGIVIVLIVLRKWRAVNIIKNVAGFFFLMLTVFELLAFFGASTNEGRYWILALSVAACVIGVTLLLVKIPLSGKN